MRGFRTGTSGRHSLRRLDVIIDTEGLAKRYGQTDALVDLTMRVEPGEVFGFLGPNGAGKTTAVKLLLGLARPTGGHGTVLDAPLGDRAARSRIGYLPELFRYQPWLRAREVLELHARLIGSGVGRSARAIDDILVDVGLLDRATDLVGGFSKGMQQRLGLGVALLGAPALVVLDEPTSALDPVGPGQQARGPFRGFHERRRPGTSFDMIERRSENVRHCAGLCQVREGADRRETAPSQLVVLVVSPAREAGDRERRRARREVRVHDEEQLAHAGHGGRPAERRIGPRVDEPRDRSAVFELEELKGRRAALHDDQPPAVEEQPVAAG